jgi:hypothetical protein
MQVMVPRRRGRVLPGTLQTTTVCGFVVQHQLVA